jgi:ribokinase
MRFSLGMRIVVVGSSNTDLVIQTPRLPQPGETILGGEFGQFAGGKGANQAVAAARAGAQVTFIGAHGDDAFGAAAKHRLRAEGIDVRHFREKPGHASGVALILVGGKSRENTIAVARSANDALTAADVRRAESAIRRAGVVVAQLEVPLSAVAEAARLAKKNGVPFVLNPAPARRLPRSLLRLVHTLIPNAREVGEIGSPRGGKTRIAGVQAAFARRHREVIGRTAALLAAGCGQVVVTLGAEGALLAGADGFCRIGALEVTPVDTVGAGDCFVAWFAVGIAEGRDAIESAERAARAAAISVTRPGAQAGMPYAREVA